MKLRVMNCKNCDAPLRLSEGKLVCDFCNSAFEIEKDSSDVAYENIVNAEEMIRRSLTDQKAEIEAHFREQEQKKIAQEEERERQRKEFAKRERRRRMIRSIRSLIITILICAAMAFGAKFLMEKYKKDQPVTTNNSSAPTTAKKKDSYRIVPWQLEQDEEFMGSLRQLIIDCEKEEHDRAVIQSSKDIWNMVEDPTIEEMCLFTSDRENGLYCIVKVVLQTKDGRTTEGYDCLVIQDLIIDEKGKVKQGEKARNHFEHSSSHDYFWGLDFDRDVLYSEKITEKRTEVEYIYFPMELPE